MAQFFVEAAGSPLFSDVLVEVSVSDASGKAVTGLKPKNFFVSHLASKNHAGASQRVVSKAAEGPSGFYILTLKSTDIDDLSPGVYILAVSVERAIKGGSDRGQALAIADLR
jgi:hypothetical protein